MSTNSDKSDEQQNTQGSPNGASKGPRRAEEQAGTILSVRGVAKSFGGTQALRSVDLDVAAGSIHGLVGKNGAGKSTLVKIIAGHLEPDTGTINFQGEDVARESLGARRERGIRLATQHAEIFPDLSVTENVLAGDLPTKRGMVDWTAAHQAATEELREFDLELDPTQDARILTLLERRKVHIAQTLFGGGVLAILDEPTEGLSHNERQQLFEFVRKLAAEGKTFMFISHYDNEIRELCSEATVLRDGEVVHHVQDMENVTSADMSLWITGSELSVGTRERASGSQEGSEPGASALELDELGGTGFGPVDLVVRDGEIVGLVGLLGSGARELARALAGHNKIESGSAKVAEQEVRLRSPQEALAHGVGYLTNDRIEEGIIGPLSVRENIVLGQWPTRGGLIDSKAESRIYKDFHDRLSLVASGPGQEIAQLSGGNQQKIMIARLLASDPKLLILDEPSFGVDVGVREDVHNMISDLAEQSGMAVVLLSSDPEELVRLADRVLIFQDGTIARQLVGGDISIETILAAQENDRKEEETR